MPNSPDFNQLVKRLKELRKHFLPAKFSPTATYTARQMDLARGYRILSHAEIEHFIEEIVVKVLRAKVGEWQANQKPSHLLICFLACYHAGWNAYEDDQNSDPLEPVSAKKKTQAAQTSADKAVSLAVNNFYEIVKRNHGIREKNLRQLLPPVGVGIDSLDPTWIRLIDSFGEERGNAAHKTARVQQQVDPKTEFDNLGQILVGLKKLDEMIFKIFST